MDKIKTVKIKNPDGSVSEETYTIAVDARNVDMENGKELQETIGTINIDNDGDISNQLKNLKSNKINKIDIIDNLESNDKNKVLSANQGKEINDKLKKKPYYYNNVADMKADTKLKTGDMAITLGYYEPNDGGNGTYRIVNNTSTTDFQEELENSKYASLIIENGEINVNQCGAYGDGVHDDTETIQNVLDKTSNFNYQINIILLDKVYCVSNLIINPKNRLIGRGVENTKILCEDASTGSIITLKEDAWHYCYLTDFTLSCRSSNNEIENGILISVDNPKYDSYSTFENIRIHYIPNGNGIWNKTGGRECRFNNIIIRECGGYGLIAGSSDSLYYNISSNHNYKAGIWNTGSNNRFINNKCYLNGENNEGTNRYELSGFYCTGIITTFTSCDAQENYGDGFYVANHNNSFINCKADANGISVVTGVDENLIYSGFYISTSYTSQDIRNCQFVVECDDFRRSTNRQAQKYGMDIKNLNSSNIVLTSRNQVKDIYYDTGYSINNSNFGNNFVVLNGNYFGNIISNRLSLKNLDNFKPWIDIPYNDDVYRIIPNNGIQKKKKKNGNYSNTPININGGDSNDGVITTDSNYLLLFKARGLGFFDATGYSQQQIPADATDLASCISSLNSLMTKLKNYGLFKD